MLNTLIFCFYNGNSCFDSMLAFHSFIFLVIFSLFESTLIVGKVFGVRSTSLSSASSIPSLMSNSTQCSIKLSMAGAIKTFSITGAIQTFSITGVIQILSSLSFFVSSSPARQLKWQSWIEFFGLPFLSSKKVIDFN